ncbi:MAG: hypothetical protein KC635_14180, partial [Myxococcales bacterium]|nr:hypothetical protein [Myxococcales bacterium]
ELGRRDDELLIRVGSHRRALLLPDSLRRRPVGAASLRDGKLRVTFSGEARTAEAPESPPAGGRRRRAGGVR